MTTPYFTPEYTSEAEVHLKYSMQFAEMRTSPLHPLFSFPKGCKENFCKRSSLHQKSSSFQCITIHTHFLMYLFHKQMHLLQIKLDLSRIKLQSFELLRKMGRTSTDSSQCKIVGFPSTPCLATTALHGVLRLTNKSIIWYLEQQENSGYSIKSDKKTHALVCIAIRRPMPQFLLE